MSAPYRDWNETELRDLLQSYRDGNGPCGMFTRKIEQIELELSDRSADITLAIDSDFRLIAKHQSIARIIPIDWSNKQNAEGLVL